MATTVFLGLLSLIISITGTSGADKFNVLYTPDSLKFLGSKKLVDSRLKEIICACLGLSIDENTVWKGLYVEDPFNTPEAVVEVCLEGVSNITSPISNQTFFLRVDKNEPDVFEAVKDRIKQRYTSGGNKLLDVRLSDPKELTTESFISVFGEVKVGNVSEQKLVHLNTSVKEDLQFLNEIETLKAITARILAGGIVPDHIVDFFNFRFSSLQALYNRHGNNSNKTREAKTLLDKALQELSKAFVKAYEGSVLVSTIVTEVAQSRRPARSPMQVTPGTGPQAKKIQRDDGDEEHPGGGSESATEEAGGGGDESGGNTEGAAGGGGSNDSGSEDDKNVQTENEDFGLVFNIMLWFGLSYIFVLLAIVYVTMAMDPGRDTVIYRMTAPRIKKDV